MSWDLATRVVYGSTNILKLVEFMIARHERMPADKIVPYEHA